MTMPHLINCDHSADGWCLACVKNLEDERYNAVILAGRYEYALQATAQRLEAIAGNGRVRGVSLLEVPSVVGMLASELQQLRDAVRRKS